MVAGARDTCVGVRRRRGRRVSRTTTAEGPKVLPQQRTAQELLVSNPDSAPNDSDFRGGRWTQKRGGRAIALPPLLLPALDRCWLNDLLRNGYRLGQREIRVRIGRQYLGDRRLGRQLRHRRHRRSLDLHFLIAVHTSTRRDQVTDDDVLLETEQLVPRAPYRGVGQNTRRLLEARGRDERLSRETRLGDAEQERLGHRGILLLLLRLVVRFPEGLLVDVLALEEHRLARLEHAHLLQHLPDDHANVLVVDLHALQAVNLLHFVEQILLHRARTLDAENVVRIHRTLGETVARSHPVTGVHAKVLAGRDLIELSRILSIRRRVLRHDSDLALAALDVAESHLTIDLGDRGRILRTARLEQLGNTRQTTGDVASLVRFAADLSEDRSGRDLLAIFNRQLRANRDHEVTKALLLAALRFPDLDVRVQLFLLVLDDDGLAETGELVELLGYRLARNQVDEVESSFHVGDDRVRVRIPREDDLILLHL